MTPSLTKRRFIGLIASGTVGTLAGCGANPPASGGATTPEATPTPTATPDVTTTPARDDENAVEVLMITDNKGSYFDPKGLQVEPGTPIRFVNDSGVHAAVTYHPDINDKPLRIPTTAEPFDSGLFSEAGASFEVLPNGEGVYDIYCPPHESLGMVCRLIVGEPHDGPGTTSPEGLPPAARDRLPEVAAIVEAGRIAGP